MGRSVFVSEERQEGEDAAFTLVVRTHDEKDIFARNESKKAPDNERGNTERCLRPSPCGCI
jgi:hypothetical protein